MKAPKSVIEQEAMMTDEMKTLRAMAIEMQRADSVENETAAEEMISKFNSACPALALISRAEYQSQYRK